MDTPTRRSVLAGGAIALSSVAGCAGFSSDSTTETGGDSATAELDRREANVMAVDIESTGDREYRFDVTLLHDDDGESGYANWWQVETLDGEQLGRRELAHAHGTQEFTRSETVAVPDDADCVVVRGHDQTHGYGGRAMTVAVPGGETSVVSQSSERRAVEAGACP